MPPSSHDNCPWCTAHRLVPAFAAADWVVLSSVAIRGEVRLIELRDDVDIETGIDAFYRRGPPRLF